MARGCHAEQRSASIVRRFCLGARKNTFKRANSELSVANQDPSFIANIVAEDGTEHELLDVDCRNIFGVEQIRSVGNHQRSIARIVG
jgi:hypothetical protein